MVPVNWTNGTLEGSSLNYSDIDKLSISNIPIGSRRYAAEVFLRNTHLDMFDFSSS